VRKPLALFGEGFHLEKPATTDSTSCGNDQRSPLSIAGKGGLGGVDNAIYDDMP